MEQDIFKIVVTGPESAGKTTLTQALAQRLQAPCVAEFARSYVTHLGRPYRYDDLANILRGQQAWETWFAAARPPVLICDTDWTVLRIWELYGYGSTTATTPSPALAPLYLLCAPDFDWQPDPVREHPQERAALFDLYHALLRDTGANFHVLNGDPETRLQTALHLVSKYC